MQKLNTPLPEDRSQAPKALPKPNPEAAGRWRAIFWALLAIILVGLLAWWFFLQPEKKGELREQAATAINDLVKDTPLAGAGDILKESPPPLPPAVVTPLTAEGTLAGRQVSGTLGSSVELPDDHAEPSIDHQNPGSSLPTASNSPSPSGESADQQAGNPEGANAAPSQNQSPMESANMDTSGVAESAAAEPLAGEAISAHGIQPGRQLEDGRIVFDQDPVSPPAEDSRVRPGYLADLANWLAARYTPGASGGHLGVSVQALNHYCGVTLAAKAEGGRAGLLRYVFQPSMIEGLYNMYADQFMEDLNLAAEKRAFTEQQNKSFHLAVAGRAVVMASALEGVLDIDNLSQSIAGIDSLAQNAVNLNADLANAVFELDELKGGAASEQQINALQMRVDGITARYRRAMDDYENARRSLAARIRRNAGTSLDQDTLLYMADWVERRLSQDPDGRGALQACARVFRDLARRCAEAGS